MMTVKKDQTNDEATIRELIERFAKAFRDKDVDGVMAPFDENIVSFDILPPLQTVGAETFVTHWQQFFESHQGPIHVEFPMSASRSVMTWPSVIASTGLGER